MLCYVMLCYVMLYYTILYYTILYYIILYYIILCYVMLCYVMLCYIILYYIILYPIISYIVLYIIYHIILSSKITAYPYLGLSQGSSARFSFLHTYQDCYSPDLSQIKLHRQNQVTYYDVIVDTCTLTDALLFSTVAPHGDCFTN